MTTREERQVRRAELVRRLSELAPKRRLDAMLEEVDGKALVRSIAAEDVYAAIVDVGLSDSTDVVQLATPEQFRTFVDLAAWQKDRVDPLEVLRWLRAARGDDDEDFMKKVASVDIEVLELLYKKLCVVHDLEESPDANPEAVTMETPEGKFLLEFRVEGPDEAALRRLTFDLMAHNPFELARFIEAVRHELPSELEETAFQFRQARLADLGFPPLEEAVKVFAWSDPDKAAPPGTPGLQAAGVRVDYVGACFKGLEDTERQNLEGEVRHLVNCVLVAEGAEPGDPPALRHYSEQVRDWLDLGFEHLTGGDAESAADVVRKKTLKEIFQVGFSLTLKLKRQVEKMAKEEGAKFGESWLCLDDEAAALKALLRRRPLRALKVPGAEPVTFRSKKELADSEALLARVRVQRRIFAGLLGQQPTEVVARFGTTLAELTAQRLFAAVAARAEIDGVLDVEPFPQLKLTELCARIFDEGPAPRVRASAGQRAVQVLAEKLEDAQGELKLMVDRVLNAFLADFGAAWAKDAKVDAAKVLALPIAGEPVV